MDAGVSIRKEHAFLGYLPPPVRAAPNRPGGTVDEQIATPAASDFSYLLGLTNTVLELNTAVGRQIMADAAKTEPGQATLRAILADHEQWRKALLITLAAFDSVNAEIGKALSGEAVGEQPLH
jgi:hypothetical protein